MTKLRCLVIEDEPLSQEILTRYIKDTPVLELAGVFPDALGATGFLSKSSIDLLFLDINLPVISGIRFLQTLTQSPMVIFTTAYPEFAVEGFESDAVDYLVKPFSFERFLRAVNKADERFRFLRVRSGDSHPLNEPLSGYLVLRADKKVYKVSFNDILYLEATGDYMKVYTSGKCLVVHETLKNMLEQLPPELFIRVHKSFIVPVKRIDYLEGNRLNVAGKMVPVGLVYKENLMNRFNG